MGRRDKRREGGRDKRREGRRGGGREREEEGTELDITKSGSLWVRFRMHSLTSTILPW